MKKRGLNKGLESLLGASVLADKKIEQIQRISIERLVANPYQPRLTFDADALDALADSIRQHGVIQPLAVRPISGDVFEIIAGERRYRAAQQAGLDDVPVVVHEVDDRDSAVFALVENLQRQDLNVVEKAKGIRSLVDTYELTHDACGKALGMSRSSISNTLRLLDLDVVVQEALSAQRIDMGHARALLPLEKAEQVELLRQVVLQGLTVREAEALVQRHGGDAEQSKKKVAKSTELRKLEKDLGVALNTKVVVSQKPSGDGKITLAFRDREMLEKIIAILGDAS